MTTTYQRKSLRLQRALCCCTLASPTNCAPSLMASRRASTKPWCVPQKQRSENAGVPETRTKREGGGVGGVSQDALESVEMLKTGTVPRSCTCPSFRFKI